MSGTIYDKAGADAAFVHDTSAGRQTLAQSTEMVGAITAVGITSPEAKAARAQTVEGVARPSVVRAISSGPAVSTQIPVVTVLPAGPSNYDQTITKFNASSVSGQYGVYTRDTNKGPGPAEVRILGERIGQPDIVTYSFQNTLGCQANKQNPQIPPYPLYRFILLGSVVTGYITPAGGGTYGGYVRVKVDGKYVTDSIPLVGTSAIWLQIDFTALGSGRRVIELECGQAALASVYVPVAGAILPAPKPQGPRWWFITDSYGNTGAESFTTGLIQRIAYLCGVDDFFNDGFGGSGFAVDTGGFANSNFVSRATDHLPYMGKVDRCIILGSVNDKSATPAATKTAATSLYQLLTNAGIPVTQFVWNASNDTSMDAHATAYKEAAAAFPNVAVVDLTREITGTGSAPIEAPTQFAATLAAATGPADGTYEYVWTAVDGQNRETTPGNRVTVTLAGQQPTLSIRPVPYASKFNIYRRLTSGSSWVKVASNITALRWTDTGAAGTAANLPTVNATAGGQTGTGNADFYRANDGTHRTQTGIDQQAINAATYLLSREAVR